MFMSIVFVFLLLLLVLAGGAAIYMGLFRAHGENVSSGRKAISGVISYGASASLWFFLYSHSHMGW